MKQYKNHIALFFATLFTVSQLYHTVHIFVEESHHHHFVDKTFVAKEKTTDNNSSGDKILKLAENFEETHDNCAICQQFQLFKIYFASNTPLEIKKTIFNNFKSIYYKDFLFPAYLLKNPSLRGPPSFFL